MTPIAVPSSFFLAGTLLVTDRRLPFPPLLLSYERRIETMMGQVARQLARLTETVHILDDRLRIVEDNLRGDDGEDDGDDDSANDRT
jgi:hypothetical protein